MAFFSRLVNRVRGLGSASGRQPTTAARPFVLQNPVIGFLNLQGERGAALSDGDSRALSRFFADCRISTDEVPLCAVLFVYGHLDASGRVEGASRSLRGLIKEAGAYVAVLPSENEPQACITALKERSDWPSNVVFVLKRKGPKFAEFFGRLFELMTQGTSMPMAWVKLAPQIPNRDNPDAPDAIFAAEAGHLTFSKQA
jgi:hypothetical protein